MRRVKTFSFYGKFFKICLTAVAFLLPQKTYSQSKQRDIRIVSGNIASFSEDNTQMFKRVVTMFSADNNFRIVSVLGSGDEENMTNLSVSTSLDFAIVSSDLLERSATTSALNQTKNKFGYVAKLDNRIIHVLVKTGVTSVGELQGSKIVVGSSGYEDDKIAATFLKKIGLTAQLFSAEPIYMAAYLQSGGAKAAIYIGPPQSAIINSYPSGTNLSFLPIFAVDRSLQAYTPIVLDHNTYPNLISPEGAAPALQISSLLVAKVLGSQDQQGRTIDDFIAAFLGKVQDVRAEEQKSLLPISNKTGLPPSVSDIAPLWKRHESAERWIRTNPLLAVDNRCFSPLRAAFRQQLKISKRGQEANLTEEKATDYFFDFLRRPELPFSAKITVHLTAKEGVGRKLGTITARNTEITIGGRREAALKLKVDLAGLRPGPHAFHLHERPNCNGALRENVAVAGLGAGGHLFAEAEDGLINKVYKSHLGDFPDVVVGADGATQEEIIMPRLSLADLVGRSIMIHATQEDYSEREACGVMD